MIQTKAVVQLVSEVAPLGYSLTLYMGIQSDSGPSEVQLLTSPNDLYRYFNTYTESPSYRMAEFCLLRGYQVYAQRVTQVTGPSSSRKFIDENGVEYFYSPRVGKDYSAELKSPFLPYANSEDAVYSQILTFIPSTSTLEVHDRFLLVVPKTIYGAGTHEIHNVPLMGKTWSLSADSEDYILRYYNVDVNIGLQMTDKTFFGYNFKDVVLAFLERNCNMTIEALDEGCEVIEKEDGTKEYQGERFLILSSSDISDFYIKNGTLSDGTPLLEIQSSDIGRNDNYCHDLDEYKVCTIYSKFPTSLDDTEVTIDLADGYYYVNIYRYDKDRVPIMSEVFQYTQKDNNILNLSLDSQLVDIEVYDESADLSGTYLLQGQEAFYNDEDFLNSIQDSEPGSTELQVDLVIDNNEVDDTDGREVYLRNTRTLFPNSIIISDFDSPFEDSSLYVQVGPSVTWLDSGYTMKGISFLLDLLPSEDKGAEVYRVRLEDSQGAVYQNQIEERDYGVTLIGTRTKISNILPLKSVISVIAMENYILNRSKVRSVEQFQELVLEARTRVNNYLSTNTQVLIRGLQQFDRELKADLIFRVDTYIIYNFRITATLLW